MADFLKFSLLKRSICSSLLVMAQESERLYDQNNCPLRTATVNQRILSFEISKKRAKRLIFFHGSERENMIHTKHLMTQWY